MSVLSSHGADAVTQAPAYIAALLDALGSRDPLDVLRGTPDALRRGIAGVPAALIRVPEAPGKWSMGQMLQHLADSELVGSFRFRMVLSHDRPPLAGYDQDLWAAGLRYDEADPEQSIADFTSLRRANVRLFERATPEQRARIGIHAERGEESLAHMMRLYAGHDVVHLRQLARIRTAVGA